MAKPKIKCYFDIVSPFSYMGFWALENLPTFKQCERTYVPLFLGGLMKLCNNRAPIEITNKGKWINIERLRWKRLFNIPMSEDMPEGFPPMTIAAQRALMAISKSHPEALAPAATALFSAMWVDLKRVGEVNVVASVLASAVGEDIAKEAMQQAQTKEIKDALIKNTNEAFEAGAFGLPWFEATNSRGGVEGFWGFDHLGQVADFLDLQKPTNSGWKAVL